MADDSLDEILIALERMGVLRNPRRVERPVRQGGAALEGEVSIEGQEVTLRLVLDPAFPLVLPAFFLRPWDALGFIPHVSPYGFVCFLDREGVVLDRRRPAQVVIDALEKTVQMLTLGARGENRADFVDEFEIYWSYLPDSLSVLSTLNPGDEVREVSLAFSKDELRWLAGDERDIARLLNVTTVGGMYSLQKGLYLPLEPGTLVTPPRHDQPFWTAEETRQSLLPYLSDANQARLHRLIKGRPRVKEYVIVKLPRPSGGESLFGIRYDAIGREHPLRETGSAERLTPLYITRLDQEYLIGRGGGMLKLADKRVLVIGCGAVGGFLVFELARAGVLDLTLVDDDKLGAENTFRHVLGQRYWGKTKADAVKEELEAQLPYLRVRTINKTIEAALADGSVSLDTFDLVVLAIGNPTVELMLNQRLQEIPDGPAGVFTWLEPLGIGGHALLTSNSSKGGCFECLFTPLDDDAGELVNRAAFAAPRQLFGRALSGCGSLHTPYGSIDAVRTANLAVRLAIDALTGKELGNPLVSWKGDATAFEAAGFRLSPRYRASQDDLDRQRYLYASVRCPICCGGDLGNYCERRDVG